MTKVTYCPGCGSTRIYDAECEACAGTGEDPYSAEGDCEECSGMGLDPWQHVCEDCGFMGDYDEFPQTEESRQ